MSKKASPTLIGLFVVGALALVVIGVTAFGSGAFLSNRPKYVLYFEGTVAGLSVGAPVAFRGVRVGTVSDIRMYFSPNNLSIRIPVIIEIDPGKITNMEGKFGGSDEVSEVVAELVNKGLRAQLKLQSLVTGQLYVDFDFYPEKKAVFVTAQFEDADIKHPELPTIPSDMEEITKTLEKIPIESLVYKAIDAVDGIERIVNSSEVRDGFTALGGALKHIGDLVENINKDVVPLIADGQRLMQSANGLAANADKAIVGVGENLEHTVAEAEKLVRKMESIVENLNARITPVADEIQAAAEDARAALNQARQTLIAFDGMTRKESPMGHQVYNALEEVAAAARSIRNMAEYLERHPEALIQGKAGNR